MDAKLLEKTEELTLYSIQLEKELKVLKQQHTEEWQVMKQKQAELERLPHQLLKQK